MTPERELAERALSTAVGLRDLSNVLSPNPYASPGIVDGAHGECVNELDVVYGRYRAHKATRTPGFIDAGMSAPFFRDQAVREQRGGGVPLRRLGTAEDVAKAVMFLASDDAAYISGQEIAIDGGVINSVLAQLPRERPAGQ